MSSQIIRAYGWRPDRPDHRDRLYKVRLGAGEALPAKFSQRPNWPAPYDQGQLGSCTGNGVGGICHYRLVRKGEQSPDVMNQDGSIPSRLFIYYNERVVEGTVRQDSGANIRDGIKVVVRDGFCFEDLWPYDIAKFARRPPLRAYRVARKELVTGYARIDNTDPTAIKQALLDDDPVVFGCTVYESFESDMVAQSGIVPMPSLSEQPVGGHCMVIIGWDDTATFPGGLVGGWEVRNSWGQWGDAGYCWMPYAYLCGQLASDFWIVSALP